MFQCFNSHVAAVWKSLFEIIEDELESDADLDSILIHLVAVRDVDVL